MLKISDMKDIKFALILFAFIVGICLQSQFVFGFEYSKIGEKCKLSADCLYGYCSGGYAVDINKICKIPPELRNYSVIGSCLVTSDCSEGFCWSKECILPAREEYDILSFGLKPGRAGLINNCTGIWCLIGDGAWLLALIASATIFYITRNRRILSLLFFAIPMISAIIIIPLLGFILALFEIIALSITHVIKLPKIKIKLPF